MSQAKPIHKYPEEYHELCKKAHTEGVRIPFPTRRKALNFRIEMYQYRTALREALRSDPENEHLQISALFAEGLEFKVEGSDLAISRKEPIHTQTIRDVL